MLIRISGGTAGIKEYLENGQKQGRDFSRDELDERVILAGDLDTTDAIIQSLDNDGERYLHITVAFKEDEISREVLTDIAADFEGFAFSAYQKDEYSFYAEAHMPRIKSYVNEQSGDFVERKPHIHIVVPKVNMLTGQHMNPFGVVEQNERFIDAFQEHVNNKFGLASPKEHRRTEFTGASEMISRYKGDIFEGQNKGLKAQILEAMLGRQVEKFEEFQGLLSELGQVATRNKGRATEYLNIKTPETARGVNLKDYVFSREFVELPMADKRRRLAADVQRQYEAAGAARRQPERLAATLKEWHQTRAREVKYLNSGNRKAWAEYRDAGPDRRQQILAEREARFYAKHRQETTYDHQTERRGGRDAGRFGRGYGFKRAAAIEHDASAGGGRNSRQRDLGQVGPRSAPQSLNRVRSLSGLGMDGLGQRGQMLLQGDAHHQLEHSRADGAGELRRSGPGDSERGGPGLSEAGRAADSVVSQLSRDHLQRMQERTGDAVPDMREVKQQLDARRLLAELSQSHGVIAEKYEVTKAKDGSDRIKCGSRNLNVSDFLTKEMNLPWGEAQQLLKAAHARQLGREPEPQQKRQAGRQLWGEFQAHRRTVGQQLRAEQWEKQRAKEREQRDAIKREFYAKRSRIQSDRRQSPAERKAAMSVARMQRLASEAALRDRVSAERQQLRDDQRRPAREQFRDYLADRAQAGDEAALAELRRMRPDPAAKELPSDAMVKTGDRSRETDHAPIHRAPAESYRVDRNGDVTYQRDGRDVLRDAGRSVQMLQHDAQTIETGLRLAQQKFGNKLELSGPQEFQEKAARIAAEAGLKVEFTDHRLNKIMQDRRAELEASKAREAEARKLAQDFAKQRAQASAKPQQEKPPAAPQKAQELAPQITDSKPPNTKQSRYTGEVLATDEKAVYQRHGRDTIRHDRAHFNELPKPGDQIQVVYQQGKASVKNLGQEQDHDRDRGPSPGR